jgi:hypothetical protein
MIEYMRSNYKTPPLCKAANSDSHGRDYIFPDHSLSMNFGYITGGYNQIKYITIAQQCTEPIVHKTLANNTSA